MSFKQIFIKNKAYLSYPNNGSIRIIKITESQYSNMIIIENYREKPEEKVAQQGQTFMVF